MIAAPAVILTPGLLMKVRPLRTPRSPLNTIIFPGNRIYEIVKETNEILDSMVWVVRPLPRSQSMTHPRSYDAEVIFSSL